jgi:sRNA-binding regulator protein Hfq
MTDTPNRKMREDDFLTALVAQRTVIALYLRTGVKIRDVVLEGFDVDTLFLRSIDHGGGRQLIYKDCVASLGTLLKGQRRDNTQTLNDVISDLVDRDAVQGRHG